MIEPVRFDFHAPSAIKNSDKRWVRVAASAFFQLSLVSFPAGFEERAFGPNLEPPKSKKIGAWDSSWAYEVFLNLQSLFDKHR